MDEYELIEVGIKHDDGKPRYDLLSPVFLEGTANVAAYGAEKYGDYNWMTGLEWSRVYRALIGHLNDWYEGEDDDQESEHHHLFHAANCLMYLCHYTHYTQYDEFDDRPDYAAYGPAPEEL
jgi:hypothetical protein